MNKIFIIAEAGVNHNGSIDSAHQLVEKAVWAGADAIKFQTFKSRSLVRMGTAKADYQKTTTGTGEDQLAMIQKLELPYAAHFALKKQCEELGIEFLSTPFERESLDFLVHDLGLKRIKIPSGEITNGPFLWEIAHTGLPCLLSTGMSTLEEIRAALLVLAAAYLKIPFEHSSPLETDKLLKSEEAQAVLKEKVTLLHCTTEYPAPFSEINLRAIRTLQKAFPCAVGYSDHTEGILIPVAAVALGATVIEKHFTLDKTLPGPDHQASLTCEELKKMVEQIRTVESSLGDGIKLPTPSEKKNIAIIRKSLVARIEIQEGEIFSETNLTAKRPGDGLSPMDFWKVTGKKATSRYLPDDPIHS